MWRKNDNEFRRMDVMARMGKQVSRRNDWNYFSYCGF